MSSTRQAAVTREQLAVNGGPKVRTSPFEKKGNRYAFNELKYLKEALDQGTLFYWHGQKVKAMCQQFAKMLGVGYAVAGSSCSAVIHAAVGAMGVNPGDEVITSPITDAGTLIGVLYQHGIPVFADLDPHTYTITADSIAKKITPRTRGIIAVHLTGNPCPMDEILQLARAKGLWVVEDCANRSGRSTRASSSARWATPARLASTSSSTSPAATAAWSSPTTSRPTASATSSPTRPTTASAACGRPSSSPPITA